MAYPHLHPHPLREHLEEHFTLTSSDLALIASLKSAQNRLGFAVLLKSYALLNYPPRNKSEVPAALVEWIAGQLDLPAELGHPTMSASKAIRASSTQSAQRECRLQRRLAGHRQHDFQQTIMRHQLNTGQWTTAPAVRLRWP